MILGLKVTHDGGLAAIEDGRLAFSVEMEKVDNRHRYSAMSDLREAVAQLGAAGASLEDVEAIVFDGWATPGSAPGEQDAVLPIRGEDGADAKVVVAGYVDSGTAARAPELRSTDGTIRLGGDRSYRSYPHVIDHVFAAYCTSPFAQEDAPSYVLVWDGGTPARLYSFDAGTRRLVNHGIVLDVKGDLYPFFAAFLEPYRSAVDWRATITAAGEFGLEDDTPLARAWFGIAGKAMAYAGLGEVDEEGLAVFREESRNGIAQPNHLEWTSRVRRGLRALGLSDAAMMATFQEFMGRELVAGLASRLDPSRDPAPLCFAGGSALNIKFNSRLRASGLVADVWVPPFPNDSGSAIGAACTEMVRSGKATALDWSVFAGLDLAPSTAPEGWQGRPCGVPELAELLHREGKPVVVLEGRTELGPRALGHRSILAPATDKSMKDHLNEIKGRESYRPVAPICLEEEAPEIFSPGTRDPHMLFDHDVRAGWRERIPAVIHVDGTARLQTVGADNPTLYQVLKAYRDLSGIPVLCNTSANFRGRGFFPDAASAMRWAGTRYVWADGTLFARAGDEA